MHLLIKHDCIEMQNRYSRLFMATIAFDGSGVALSGSISKLSQNGLIRVFIDGVSTFDRTGLWQNHSMQEGDSVFFAWRWPVRGRHVIRLEPANEATS